jgi:hypothetical protein
VRCIIVVLPLVLSACAVIARSVPLGPPEPPRPYDCPIAFARVTPSDASTRWREVGAVCLAKGSYITVDEVYAPGDLHDRLAVEACNLGGEVVLPVGTCSANRSGAIEFGVYASRR